MRKIIVDFETYSDVPLQAGDPKDESINPYGLERYFSSPNFKVLCMGYKVDDNPTQLWLPNTPWPDFKKDDIFYAYNAYFDYRAMRQLGVKTFINQWRDLQAMALRVGLPRGLDRVLRALHLKVRKDPKGKQLIMKCCIPGGNPSEQDYQDLYEYCRNDVEVEYKLLQELPIKKLTEQEQRVWETTAFMNERGIPVDTESAKTIYEAAIVYRKSMTEIVPELTSGQVERVTQTKKLAQFLGLPNCQADTIAKAIKTETDPTKKLLLELRQSLGQSSVAKYKRLLELEYNGRIYHNFVYHGAHTGRWTSEGFQLQNLPRFCLKDPDSTISSLASGDYDAVGDLMTAAKGLIRAMIKAKCLYVADYSSIENILLVWAAEDQAAVNAYAQGIDQYKDMAAFLYKIKYDDVTKDQRQLGKFIILGAGYMMGARTLVKTADRWGVDISLSEAEYAIKAYRIKYKKVVQLWYGLLEIFRKAAAHNPEQPTQVYKYGKFSTSKYTDQRGRSWLVFHLPSGRSIAYYEPSIAGRTIRYWGVHPQSKQWTQLYITPTKIIENAIQGLARDIMAQGIINVLEEHPNMDPIATVHDELICEGEDDNHEKNLQLMIDLMTRMPDWCKDMPLRADGYYAFRYKKA